MEFKSLIQRLEKVLKGPLPGKEGQILMAPKPLEEERFDLNRMKQARKGAVLLLFYPGSGTGKVPFIKRPVYKGVHSGQVALPGGKMDPGDKDLSATALRETEEEIGVDRNKIQLVGELSELYILPSNFSVKPFIGYTLSPPEFLPDAREVEKVITCEFDQLLNDAIKREKVIKTLQGVEIMAPYFEIENEVIWGATAMIVSEFLSLWKNSKQ